MKPLISEQCTVCYRVFTIKLYAINFISRGILTPKHLPTVTGHACLITLVYFVFYGVVSGSLQCHASSYFWKPAILVQCTMCVH